MTDLSDIFEKIQELRNTLRAYTDEYDFSINMDTKTHKVVILIFDDHGIHGAVHLDNDRLGDFEAEFKRVINEILKKNGSKKAL